QRRPANQHPCAPAFARPRPVCGRLTLVRMPTHAALRRAVNLGATRQVKSVELCVCLEGAGFEEVAAFRTSGNVVLGAGGSAGEITKRIEEALADGFGFEVPVYLRTESQLKRITANEPFPTKVIESSKGKLQVAFLPAKPSAGKSKEVLA